MNLRTKFVFSIGLLGLLCLMLPGSLRADDFIFSFTNTIGDTSGTVTVEILGLTNNATSAPTKVILKSYPAVFMSDPDLTTAPVDITTWGTVHNVFVESAGTITGGSFSGDSPSGDTAITLDAGFSGGVEQLFWAQIGIHGANLETSSGLTITPLTSAVPEPGTLSQMSLGIGMVLVIRRMRKCKGLVHHQAT
jgi:hypothetical protein